jgi:MSHA biogenesis protein MshK
VFNPRQLVALLFSATFISSTALAAQPLVDPMQPPGKVAGSSATKTVNSVSSNDNGFHLNAIRIARDQRSASINGKTVRVGERIGSARVVSIQASSVTLQRGGKMMTISLLPFSVKNPVEAVQP